MTERPSPLQNRMTPLGEIEAVAARGRFTGNRGVLHDDAYRLLPARWKHRNWIICALAFRGRWRRVMTPRRWTELFFLDEATALAAGHRPCAECRRAAYDAWMDAAAEGTGLPRPRAADLDVRLHAERAEPGARRLRRHGVRLEDLPPGAFVVSADGEPALVLEDSLLPWRHQGYGPPMPRRAGATTLLTPPTSVAALRAGYRADLHPSAGTPIA